MALDNAAGPMKNVNARRAVWAALDREAIVEAEGGPIFRRRRPFIYPGSSAMSRPAAPRSASGLQRRRHGTRRGQEIHEIGRLSERQVHGARRSRSSAQMTRIARGYPDRQPGVHAPRLPHPRDRGRLRDDVQPVLRCSQAGNRRVPVRRMGRDFADPRGCAYIPFSGRG